MKIQPENSTERQLYRELNQIKRKLKIFNKIKNKKLLTFKPDIGQMVRVFANGPGDQGSIPGRVIPKTQKMVLDATLLNTQHYKGMD